MAIGKIDRRIEDQLVTVFDAVAHLNTGAEIAHHVYLVKAGETVFDDRDIETVAVEDNRASSHHTG